MEYTKNDYQTLKCTEKQYYSQYINEEVKQIVLKSFDIQRLAQAYKKREELTYISNPEWSAAVRFGLIRTSIIQKFQDNGDCLTTIKGITLLKLAAESLIKESVHA